MKGIQEFVTHDYFTLYITILFFHIIADYNLQGVLAQMKSVRFWKDLKERESKRKDGFKISIKDWIMPMIEHSFMWSFIVHLPIIMFYSINPITIIVSIIIHTCFHMLIDSLKANTNDINLIADQLFHMLQIILIIPFVFNNK
jgi:hypothetical protein